MDSLVTSLRRLLRGIANLFSSVTDLKLPWGGLTRKTRYEAARLAAEQLVLTPRDCALVLGLDAER